MVAHVRTSSPTDCVALRTTAGTASRRRRLSIAGSLCSGGKDALCVSDRSDA